MRPNNLPHLEATAEESALLRGFGAAGNGILEGGVPDDGRGHRKHRDPNIPRTPSPVYQYEKSNPYSDHSAVYAQGGRGGAAIPEDRPLGSAFGALTGKGPAAGPTHAP